MKYSLGLYEKAIPSGKSFKEMLEITRETNFDRLEISIDESDERQARLDWSLDEMRNLGRLSREYNVPIRTMCLSGHRKYPLGSHDEDTRKRSMEIMEKAINFSLEAGISIIQLAGYDVYYEEGDETTRKYFLENLNKSAQYAAEKGVILAFETMETPFMDTVEKSMKYVSEINNPYLGVYPDIGNLKNAAVLYNHDVVEDLYKGKGHIFAMHLKETKPGVYRDMDFGSGGHTEYERCIRAAFDMGVHIFTGEFWHQKDVEDYMTVIKNANKFLREKLDKCEKESEEK